MNTPAPTNTCRQCGGPMASNAPEGLCARCLLSVAMKEPEPPVTGAATPTGPSASASLSDLPDIADAADVARRLPQFEILELLGRGGMGVVYKARQLNLDRIVALKILPPADALTPDFVERFRREARSLAKLSHPNIVNVHEIGETGGLYYFVMEFVDGVNLRDMIRAGKMKPEEALAVVPKICDALQFAHEEGVVHRDIKPENILIDKRGRVKIADFGLAKLLRREQSDHTLTMSGMTLGTPRYMAPEQLDKPETVDHRADIYSLGVVFYEMLTGEVPMGRFAPPSEKVRIDVRLDEIVLHALERDADRRYQHASQVRDDVEKVTSKPVAAPTAHGVRRFSRVAIILGIAAALLLACAGFAVYDLFAAREAMVRRLTPLADTVGGNSVAGLMFDDWDNTKQTLAALKAEPSVVAACVYNIEGKVIATYVREGVQDFPPKPGPDDVRYAKNHLVLFRPIASDGNRIGSLYIKASLENRLWLYVGICVLVVGGFLLAAAPKLVSDLHARRKRAKEVTAPNLPIAPKVSAPANERKPDAEKAASEPQAAPPSPAEEAVRRARASWFGRRSERFRALLPPALFFLQLVLILASFAGWPSPWLELKWTYTPHKHGAIDSTTSHAFHPFTLSFFLIVGACAIPFIAKRLSRIDSLVRYGCRFRELRKDIQRQAKLNINGCAAAAFIAPILIAVLFEVITSGGVLRTVGSTYHEFQLGPNSKAYEELLIDMPFYSNSENGVEHYRRPNQWDMAIGLKTKNSAEPVTMDIEMPSLRASYQPSWSKDYEVPIVLDLDELTKWMSDRGKLEVKDEKVKKEAVELMALLKRFSRQAPVEMNEFFAAREELMPDFWNVGFRGWPGRNGSFSSMNGGWLMAIYLGSAVVFLALYFVVASRIQRAAFALDREVRERGESVLAPLPRVKFGALPRDIRARTIRRAVLAAVGLLLLPAAVAWWQAAQPVPVQQTWHYGFSPRPTFEKNDTGNGAQIARPSPLLKHFQEVILTFTAFASYQRDGETWFVQPHPLHLELTFCRPKNFSDKPGEFHEVIPPGKGAPEGETFSFTVELPSLHANMDYMSNKSSVTLDEEELLRWMGQTIATTTVSPTGSSSSWVFRKPDGTQVTLYSLPMSETPELKSLAADLMAFLKNYATSAPTTRDAFIAAARKIPSLNGHSSTTTFHAESHKGVAIIPALIVAILIFLALLPLLKRSAVRAAMRQGTLNIAPQTSAPASETQPGEVILAGKSVHGPLRSFLRTFNGKAIIGCLVAAASAFLPWRNIPWHYYSSGFEHLPGKVAFFGSLAVALAFIIFPPVRKSIALWRPLLLGGAAIALLALCFWESAEIGRGETQSFQWAGGSVQYRHVAVDIEAGLYVTGGIAIALLFVSALQIPISLKDAP